MESMFNMLDSGMKDVPKLLSLIDRLKHRQPTIRRRNDDTGIFGRSNGSCGSLEASGEERVECLASSAPCTP